MYALNAFFLFFVSMLVSGYAAPIRGGTGEATYYATGLGACGGVSHNTDFIVAVSLPIFNGFPGAGKNSNKNPICGKKLTAHYQGKDVTVTVVDSCPGCAKNDIDLSPSAFEKLAPLGKGRLSGVKWTLG
ncbi:hypothetical protein EIP91_009983 [Steccherinum ochraceum]|uniref:RlpA-like protein double-psi beta-barrel domain-containing protein n=1 Tax=Steccherinum ochraceum TaxID=92696 RepID=A0A4R0RT37_9APHY|nr:hypothetical protein EIP91_009983 [Steccherinum ochraceum]